MGMISAMKNARLGVAAIALLRAIGSSALAGFQAPPYRGSQFGDLLARPKLARDGLRVFRADHSRQIRGTFNASFCSECHFLPTLDDGITRPPERIVGSLQALIACTSQIGIQLIDCITRRNLKADNYATAEIAAAIPS
jgi:hypothetical protein